MAMRNRKRIGNAAALQLHGLGAVRVVSAASPALVGVVMDKIEPYSAILEVASRFEPDANRLPLETKILLSIAISVKRIADERERPPRRRWWRVVSHVR